MGRLRSWQKADFIQTAFLCLQHRNHCVVTSKRADISVRLDMLKTIPKPLAKSAGLCYNTKNLPWPCITHDFTGGFSDHRTDHRRFRSTRNQWRQKVPKAFFPEQKGSKATQKYRKKRILSLWDVDAAGSNPVTPIKRLWDANLRVFFLCTGRFDFPSFLWYNVSSILRRRKELRYDQTRT